MEECKWFIMHIYSRPLLYVCSDFFLIAAVFFCGCWTGEHNMIYTEKHSSVLLSQLQSCQKEETGSSVTFCSLAGTANRSNRETSACSMCVVMQITLRWLLQCLWVKNCRIWICEIISILGCLIKYFWMHVHKPIRLAKVFALPQP